MAFSKWTSIDGFHNVRKNVTIHDLYHGSVTYRGKIKLHGTLNNGCCMKQTILPHHHHPCPLEMNLPARNPHMYH